MVSDTPRARCELRTMRYVCGGEGTSADLSHLRRPADSASFCGLVAPHVVALTGLASLCPAPRTLLLGRGAHPRIHALDIVTAFRVATKPRGPRRTLRSLCPAQFAAIVVCLF